MNVFEKAWENMRRGRRHRHRTPAETRLPTAPPAPAAGGPSLDALAKQNQRLAAERGIDLAALPPAPEAIGPAAAIEAPPAPPPSTSDEGVLYEWVSSTEIVNLSDDPVDGRRRELHVGGRAYHHVAESLGHWLYRRDA